MDLGLIIKNDKVVVSSRTIAEIYEKEHRNVLRDIRNIIDTVPEVQRNFEQSFYINTQNKKMPEYIIDRQGFSILILGFTGEKSKKFTYKYTLAFEDIKDVRKKSYIYLFEVFYVHI